MKSNDKNILNVEDGHVNIDCDGIKIYGKDGSLKYKIPAEMIDITKEDDKFLITASNSAKEFEESMDKVDKLVNGIKTGVSDAIKRISGAEASEALKKVGKAMAEGATNHYTYTPETVRDAMRALSLPVGEIKPVFKFDNDSRDYMNFTSKEAAYADFVGVNCTIKCNEFNKLKSKLNDALKRLRNKDLECMDVKQENKELKKSLVHSEEVRYSLISEINDLTIIKDKKISELREVLIKRNDIILNNNEEYNKALEKVRDDLMETIKRLDSNAIKDANHIGNLNAEITRLSKVIEKQEHAYNELDCGQSKLLKENENIIKNLYNTINVLKTTLKEVL